jgi:hypothetical protein
VRRLNRISTLNSGTPRFTRTFLHVQCAAFDLLTIECRRPATCIVPTLTYERLSLSSDPGHSLLWFIDVISWLDYSQRRRPVQQWRQDAVFMAMQGKLSSWVIKDRSVTEDPSLVAGQ